MKHKSKILRVNLALVLALGFAVSALADTIPGPPSTNYTTAIYLQNKGAAADVAQIQLYDAAGVATGSPIDSPSIPTLEGRYLVLPSGTAGQFSAIVSSGSDMVALAYSTGLAGSVPVRDSYASFGSADIAAKLYAPNLNNGYYGFNSNLIVQNTEDRATSVNIKLLNSAGAVAYDQSFALNAFGFKALDITTLALPTGDPAGLYSAVVESNNGAAIAGVVNTWTSTGGNSSAEPELLQYPMKTTGSTSALVPFAAKGYYTFITAVVVQNIDTVAAEVTINYTTPSNTVVSVVKTIQPNQSYTDLPFTNGSLPGTFGGDNEQGLLSAEVVSTNGKQILVLVNEQSLGEGMLAAYIGGRPADSAARLYGPVMHKQFTGLGGNLFGSLTIQNTTTDSANVTVKAPQIGGVADFAFTLGPKASRVILYNVPAANPTGHPGWPDGNQSLAQSSLVIESNKAVFAIVNLNDITLSGAPRGDGLGVYTLQP